MLNDCWLFGMRLFIKEIDSGRSLVNESHPACAFSYQSSSLVIPARSRMESGNYINRLLDLVMAVFKAFSFNCLFILDIPKFKIAKSQNAYHYRCLRSFNTQYLGFLRPPR